MRRLALTSLICVSPLLFAADGHDRDYRWFDPIIELRSLIDAGETDEYYERAYERLMQKGVPFSYADVSMCQWCEIDDADDLATAEAMLAGSRA